MSEESTTPDLLDRVRSRVEVGDRGDVAAMTSFFAPDAVYDSSPMGLEIHEGRTAIRRFLEDWWGSYEASEVKAEEILDLGNGVTFAVVVLKGRPAGSGGEVRLRYAAVNVWVEGVVARITNYSDIDQARAAAERLAKERG
jgi:ketosteroid isomerase-like protein